MQLVGVLIHRKFIHSFSFAYSFKGHGGLGPNPSGTVLTQRDNNYSHLWPILNCQLT